jgi:hypothetical protein
MDSLRWDVGPENINPGGNGLSCTTADFLKLGIVHLQNGEWGGRQLLDPAWVRAATRDANGAGYGYHWWIGPSGSYFAAGAFGQFAFIFPDHDAVLAVTAALPIRDDKLRPIVWQHFPAVFGKAPASGAKTAAVRADRRLLPILQPAGSATPAKITGRTYTMAANDDGVEEVGFEFQGATCRFTMRDRRGDHEVLVGLDDWHESSTTVSGGSLHHGYEPGRMQVVAGGWWPDDDTFEMTWQFVESPFRDTVVVRFSGDELTLDRSVNVNSGSTTRPSLRGTVHS